MNSFQQTFRHLVDASDVLAGPPLHPAPSSIPPTSSCSSGPTPSSSSSSELPPSFSSFIGPTPASFSSSGPLEFITSVEVFPGIASEGCFFYLSKRLDYHVKSLGLSPSPPSSCRTSFLSWLTSRKHGLEHPFEQHNA